MAIRTIIHEDDETLRKVSRPVERFDERLWELLEDMKETMYDANGVGLAAVQVGVLRQAIVIDVGNGPIELINPEILCQKGEQRDTEGCLSCPGEYGIVVRPKKVKVRALDRFGNEVIYKGEDLLARAFCHEIDHLSGRIFKDIAQCMVDTEQN